MHHKSPTRAATHMHAQQRWH